jgi:hypothetical protein
MAAPVWTERQEYALATTAGGDRATTISVRHETDRAVPLRIRGDMSETELKRLVAEKLKI